MVIAELDCACTAQAHIHWVYAEFSCGHHHRIARHLGWGLEDDVIAALGFQWDFQAEFSHQIFGPDTSGDDGVRAFKRAIAGVDAGDAVVGFYKVLDFGLDELAAFADKVIGQFGNVLCGVGDVALALEHREALGGGAEDGFSLGHLRAC